MGDEAARGRICRATWLHPGTCLVVALLLPPAASGCGLFRLSQYRARIKREMARPRTFGPAHLDIVEGLPVLHLYGTPEEMGRQYGTILRPALQAEYRYFDLLTPRLLDRQMQRKALAREPRLPDQYRRELKAIAQAADVPYEVAVTANLSPRVGCTALLAWGRATADGSMIFGRNGESLVPGLHDRGSLIVVWHPTGRPAQASLTFLGMIGTFSGINEAGLCWGNLVVYNARERGLNEEGFPIQFVLREAGERYTTAQQLRDRLLKEVPLVPMQVAIADTKSASIVELSTASRAGRAPMNDYLAAGNLFLARERRRSAGPPWFRRRYETLIAWAEEHHGRIDAYNIAQALYEARAPYPFNIQTMVFEPAKMKMYVSFNRYPASAGPFVELDLKTLFNAPPATAAAES